MDRGRGDDYAIYCSFPENTLASYTFGEGTYSLTKDVTKIQGYAHLAVYKRNRISPRASSSSAPLAPVS